MVIGAVVPPNWAAARSAPLMDLKGDVAFRRVASEALGFPAST